MPPLFRSTKPHFLQPFLPGSEHNLSIPDSFFNYLGGRDQIQTVLLRQSNCGERVWPVKLSRKRLQDGWKEFVNDNDLHVGDFLLFRHDLMQDCGGDMVLDVMVMTPGTSCGVDCPLNAMEVPETKVEKDLEDQHEAKQVGSTRLQGYLKSKKKKRLQGYLKSKKKLIFHDAEAGPSLTTQPKAKRRRILNNVKGRSSLLIKNSNFIATLSASGLAKGQLSIPLWFARMNNLTSQHWSMILKDEKGNCWPMKVGRHANGQILITGGWFRFSQKNGIRAGDVFIIELIKGGKRPIMQFHGHCKEE